jgi:drug/metabolite transporter (DMT)-like permease
VKLFRPYAIWSTVGVVLFVIAGIALGTGRFGAGVLLMAGAALCLGTGMAAQKRWNKKNRSV